MKPNLITQYGLETAVLLQKILGKVEADPRIVACWLFGSHGRGDADTLSDLDLWLVINDVAYAELMADRDAFLARWGTAVLHLEAPQNAPLGGSYLGIQFDAPVAAHHVDVYWQPQSVAVRPPETNLCFQTVPIPTADAPLLFPQRELTQAEQERQERPFHQFSYLWVMIMVLAKTIWRQPTGSAIQYLEYALGTLHALQEKYDLPTTFLDSPAFATPVEKLGYLLNLSNEVKALMKIVHQRGEKVPFESVDGAERFIQMVGTSLAQPK